MIYPNDDISGLKHGEEVLWRGAPATWPFVRRSLTKYLAPMLLLPLTACAAVVLGNRFLDADISPDVIHLVVEIASGIAGLFCILFVWAGMADARQIYILTNKRIIIRKPAGRTQMESEIDLAKRPESRLNEMFGRIGTITFGAEADGYQLQFISNAREVYELIQNAEGLVSSPISSEISYPKDWLYNPFAQYLRPEEHFLWLGKPQARAFTKSRFLNGAKVVVPLMLVLAVIFIAMGLAILFFGIAFLALFTGAVAAMLNSERASGIRYAATNRRILISSRPVQGNCIIAISHDHITVNLEREGSDFGTITFDVNKSAQDSIMQQAKVEPHPIEISGEGFFLQNAIVYTNTRYDHNRPLWPDISFRGIPDAQRVCDIIQEAKKALTPA